jgi:hypothetical protein
VVKFAAEHAVERTAHRAARSGCLAYRLNAVVLLGSGWSPAQLATALLINDDRVRSQFKVLVVRAVSSRQLAVARALLHFGKGSQAVAEG